MAVLAVSGLTVSGAGALFTSPAGAATTVTAVSGSAYGEKVAALSGNSGPMPTVTLPSTGGGPLTANDPGVSVAALTTGAMSVSTQGTLGPVGRAESSATVNTPTVPTNPPSQPPLFTASQVTSTCLSDGTTSTGSVTFTLGYVRNTPIIAPAPNTTISDPLYGNVILNEQIVTTTATGTSITVNAAHISRFPADDIIIGQTHCDTTFAQVTTTTSTTLPSTPTVTAVSGSAYGEKVTALSGNSGPTPTVTLPSAGGGPLTASDPGVSVPALMTGAMNVSTQGTLGPAGQAQSSSVVNNATVPTNPPQQAPQPPLFAAFRLDSQCTATAAGVTGSASFVGGFVRNTPIPFAPAPNTIISDPLYGNVIVNEQIVNNTAMGTEITVNAAHISRFPADDIILGQSHCDTTFASITTTTTTSSTTTTTTLPATTTTTLPATTTTTLPPTTTTTLPTGPTCNGKRATIVGTPGNDRIFGTPGDDVIVGLGGADQIYSYAGNDTICAGDGNDVVYGGDGNDYIDGGAGDDRIIGDAGNDHLFGGPGSDRLFAGSGTVLLDGGLDAPDYCYKGTGITTFVNCEVYPAGM